MVAIKGKENRGFRSLIRSLFGRAVDKTKSQDTDSIAPAVVNWSADDFAVPTPEDTISDPWDVGIPVSVVARGRQDSNDQAAKQTAFDFWTSPDFEINELSDTLSDEFLAPAAFELEDTEELINSLEKEITSVSKHERDESWIEDSTILFEDDIVETDSLDDFTSDLELFEFDEEATQNPWITPEAGQYADGGSARSKAASVYALLQPPRNRGVMLPYLIHIFEEFPHPATYRAIHVLALSGLDFWTLQSMAELKRIWAQRSEWWLARSRGEFRFLPFGSFALTWRLAHRICLARADYSPEDMIDDDWLAEWMCQPSASGGSFSFPSYLYEKMETTEAQLLCRGFGRLRKASDLSEVSDRFNWWRIITNDEVARHGGFRIITPYEERLRIIECRNRNLDSEEPRDTEGTQSELD